MSFKFGYVMKSTHCWNVQGEIYVVVKNGIAHESIKQFHMIKCYIIVLFDITANNYSLQHSLKGDTYIKNYMIETQNVLKQLHLYFKYNLF